MAGSLPAPAVLENFEFDTNPEKFTEVCIKERLSRRSREQDWVPNGTGVIVLRHEPDHEKYEVRYFKPESRVEAEGFVKALHVQFTNEEERPAKRSRGALAGQQSTAKPKQEVKREVKPELTEERTKQEVKREVKQELTEERTSSSAKPIQTQEPEPADQWLQISGCPECDDFKSGCTCSGFPGCALVRVTGVPGCVPSLLPKDPLCTRCYLELQQEHNFAVTGHPVFRKLKRSDYGP